MKITATIINMNRAIPPSDLNRTKRSESLRKLSAERNLFHPLQSTESSLKLLVEEIIKYLIEIIQRLLLEENSNNYIVYLKKTEQMNEQLQNRMERMIQEKYDELRLMIAKEENHQSKRIDTNSHIKSQRKKIAQSILSHQKFNPISLGHQKSQELLRASNIRGSRDRDQVYIQNEEGEQNHVDSSEIKSISERLVDLQKGKFHSLGQICKSLEDRLVQNSTSLQEMAKNHVQFKMKIQQKLDSNLQALWNVVTDLKTSLFTLQNEFSQQSFN